jgi:hypothetical protein
MRIHHPRPRQRAVHLRPRVDMDPAPLIVTRTTTSFATEVSPTWTPNAPSLLGHQIYYIFMSMWITDTCLDSSFLIDWLGFDGWFFLVQVYLNILLLTDEVIWTVEIHFNVPCATIFALQIHEKHWGIMCTLIFLCLECTRSTVML